MAMILANRELALLHPAARSVGGPAVRAQATVGGNLFAPPPYGDFAAALLALDARVSIQSGYSPRDVPIDEFLRGRDFAFARGGGRGRIRVPARRAIAAFREGVEGPAQGRVGCSPSRRGLENSAGRLSGSAGRLRRTWSPGADGAPSRSSARWRAGGWSVRTWRPPRQWRPTAARRPPTPSRPRGIAARVVPVHLSRLLLGAG